jgi:tRNA(Ile)-lysidine synthase
MKNLEKHIDDFIREHIDIEKPILLGLSGGADSICLMYLLNEFKKRSSGLYLHIAHVDHGWRDESPEEAKFLSDLCHSLSLPLHSTRLSPIAYEGNWEDISRKERLSYFQDLQRDLGAQGIFLAHHADDQSETIFKRVLEGGSILKLRGISEVSMYRDLTLFRPLLSYTKTQIIDWLDAHNISYFNDSTNKDQRYLRARLRETIFPFLRKEFGKAFEKNLCVLGEDARSLDNYISKKLAALYGTALNSDLGRCFDFSQSDIHPFEMTAFIRSIAEKHALILSREEVKVIQELLLMQEANKKISRMPYIFQIDRGRLFFQSKEPKIPANNCRLEVGFQKWGSWSFTVHKALYERNILIQNSWQDIWNNSISTVVPAYDGYTIAFHDPKKLRLLRASSAHETKEYGRWLNVHKVPRFLTAFSPIIIRDDLVYEDFLTGSEIDDLAPGTEIYVIKATRD